MNDDLVLYGGTYLNKGGAAIAYGTIIVLRELGLNFKYIIDPEPYFPFQNLGLVPVYRYSDTFSVNPIPSVSPIYTAVPFLRCLINSLRKDVRQFKGIPIWHIGDSPFMDTRSALSIVGQIVSLFSLKMVLGSRAIVGGVSLSQPVTKLGKLTLPGFFKNDVDYTYTRGENTDLILKSWGVSENKYSPPCDFAFHIDKDDSYTLSDEQELIINSENYRNKKKIGLILREFKTGETSQKYLQRLIQFINVLENENYELYYIPTTYAFLIPENDYRYLTDILHISKGRIISIRDNTPGEIVSIMSNFDCVISTRLHGAILGTLAHVPTIHFYEGSKSIEVLKNVYGDIVPMINLNLFTNENNNEYLLHLVIDLLSRKEQISEELETSIHIAREKNMLHLKATYKAVMGV